MAARTPSIELLNIDVGISALNNDNNAGEAPWTAFADIIQAQWRLFAGAPFASEAAAATADEALLRDPQRLMAQLQEAFARTLAELREHPSPPTQLLEQLSKLTQQLGVWPLSTNPGAPEAPGAIPLLGPAQAQQQKAQAAWEAVTEFAAAQQRYADRLGIVAERTLKAIADALTELPREADTKATQTAVLEAAESAYEAALDEDEYALAFSRMANAFNTALTRLRELFEPLLKLLGLPSQAELESTQRRLHQLRREHRALRDAFDASELQALHEEVRALRLEVARLRGDNVSVP